MIPAFLSNGFLAPGIYDATISEIESGISRGNLAKSDLMLGLKHFLRDVSSLNSVILDIFIDGGFISIYPISSDIDILIVVKDNEGAEKLFDFFETFNPIKHGLDIKVSPDLCFPEPDVIHEYFACIVPEKIPGLSGKKGYLRLKI